LGRATTNALKPIGSGVSVRHGRCANGTPPREAEESLATGRVGWADVFLDNYLPRANTAAIHI
jgi:hypothetical protein